MTLVQLISDIAGKTSLTKAQVTAVMELYENEVRSLAETGDSLKSSGFGTFYAVKLKPRKIPNGGMSESRTVIRFRQSKS